MSSLGVSSWERIKLLANVKNYYFIATNEKICLSQQGIWFKLWENLGTA